MGAPAVHIWAHRGCSYRYPENTLSAFSEALRYDIAGIELDVQMTRDGELVVIHDETVDRTTDGTGNVADLTLAELKALHVEANPESGLDFESVPTFAEVLDLIGDDCRDRGLLLNIELKNSVVPYEGMEAKVAEAVRARDMERCAVYSSFNADSVARMKELAPAAQTAVLAASAADCIELARQVRADAIHPMVKRIDVEELWGEVACPVRAWNVREFEPFFPSAEALEELDLADLRDQGVTDLFTNAPERYVGLREAQLDVADVRFFDDKGVDAETGMLTEAAGGAVNWEPIAVYAGDKLVTAAPCRLYFYEHGIDPELVHTYFYQLESNWTRYVPDESDAESRLRELRFDRDGHVRLSFEGASAAEAAASVRIERAARPLPSWPRVFQDECAAVCERVAQVREPGDLVLAVISDIHYAFGGLWDDTARNLRQLSRRLPLDGIVQLGDLTDGLMPAELTEEVSARVLRDLQAAGVPVFGCLGNHDSNYFRGNSDRLDEGRQARACLGRTSPEYYVDFPAQRMRLVFLASFDPDRKQRYGFSRATCKWLKSTLKSTPAGYKLMVFSHVPPSARIHVWSDAIENGWKLITRLERHNKLHGGAVLAYMHGHNHADQVFSEYDFPIISIGCAKLEDFGEHKPQGSTTPARVEGEASQELFDILVVKPHLGTVDLFRFGAGEDRWAGPK